MKTLQDFRSLVERDKAEYFREHYSNLTPPTVKINPGIKYDKVDESHNGSGCSGMFMVTKAGDIHLIKAYGVINKKRKICHMDEIDSFYWGDYSPIRKA